MAPATSRIRLQYRLRVRLRMTFLTSNDRFVLRMAFSTTQRCMFCVTPAQHAVSIFVAVPAGLLGNILGINNLKGLVGWVAEHTVSLSHLRTVGLVALQALRSVSMLSMMTRVTIELRVLRNVCLHLLIYFGMTYVAAMFQIAVGRDIQRRVDFRVTGRTLGQLRPVNLFMTGLAFWQDVLIFYLVRPIDVKLLMTFHAVNPMFTTRSSYELVKMRMATPALLRFHGLNTGSVDGGEIGLRARLRCSWSRTSGKA